MEKKLITSDVLIIGGGTAGCYAAYVLGSQKDITVTVVDKAHIKRSGCLAAGVNAINAYITKGNKPIDYVNYAKKDAKGIVREDLLLTIANRLNHVTEEMEKMGLVILKDENGEYVTRGNRNIKINGENIKPILANTVYSQENVKVINHVNVTDFKVKNNKIYGAYGFDVNDDVAYEFSSKVVLVATGGASGLYKPNNPGFSRHKMWYSPFNTGAGYAMGINAGAEMTTFEMRFIALRCKDTIAPTGTIAQGVHAGQINSKGENYEKKYGIATCERVYGTTRENVEGRGPCYLNTKGISKEVEEDLFKAYLNMEPSQTLKWIEDQKGPSVKDVEIEGTEPYVVGGHTASGYWIDEKRATTIEGLYAAGDVAGGAPQKYVTGALAEGEIAAESMIEFLKENKDGAEDFGEESEEKIKEYVSFFNNEESLITIEQVEEKMQKIMDQYAGGIGSNYQFNESKLDIAMEQLEGLEKIIHNLHASDTDDLLQIYEIKERITVCKVLVSHMKARKETRWNGFLENMDYPKESDEWLKYVNSKMENGKINIILRDLVKADDESAK